MKFSKERLMGFMTLSFIAFFYLILVNEKFFLFEGGTAHYLAMARSISEGNGYYESWLSSPRPHLKMPPLVPYLIALVESFFGENIVAIKFFFWLFFVLGLLFSYLIFEKIAGWKIALVCSALAFLTPLSYIQPRRIISEIPYIGLSYTSLYLLLKLERENLKTFEWVFISLLVTLCYFTRTTGIILVLAIILSLTLKIKEKETKKKIAQLFFPICILAIAGTAWGIRCFTLKQEGDLSYIDELFMKIEPYSIETGAVDLQSPLRKELPKIGAFEFLERVISQLKFYLMVIAEQFFPYYGNGLKIVAVIILMIIAFGMFEGLKRKWYLLFFYSFGSLVTTFIWPYRDSRFLVPILGILVFFFVFGAFQMVEFFKNKHLLFKASQGIIFFVLFLSFLGMIKRDFEIATDTISKNKPVLTYRVGKNFLAVAETEPRALALELFKWVRENTPGDSVVAFYAPDLVYLITERKTASVPAIEDTERFWAYLEKEGVDYLIVDELYRELGGGAYLFTPRYVIPALNANRTGYRVSYRVPGTQSAVVELLW